ncbi:MAG TPA: isoprenyl transferase, partial [Microbacterium sp.]|nr:isoprenyl transferase [Microbacterium sp.]
GKGPLYRLYTARLRRELTPENMPHHIAMMIDGNRRWARQLGYETAAHGHRAGAAKMREF